MASLEGSYAENTIYTFKKDTLFLQIQQQHTQFKHSQKKTLLHIQKLFILHIQDEQTHFTHSGQSHFTHSGGTHSFYPFRKKNKNLHIQEQHTHFTHSGRQHPLNTFRKNMLIVHIQRENTLTIHIIHWGKTCSFCEEVHMNLCNLEGQSSDGEFWHDENDGRKAPHGGQWRKSITDKDNGEVGPRLHRYRQNILADDASSNWKLGETTGCPK